MMIRDVHGDIHAVSSICCVMPHQFRPPRRMTSNTYVEVRAVLVNGDEVVLKEFPDPEKGEGQAQEFLRELWEKARNSGEAVYNLLEAERSITLQNSSYNEMKNETNLERLTQMISDFFSDVTGIQLLAADFMHAKHGTSASKGRKTHEASQLKKDEEQGVYVFIVDREHCLKVGFAGKKSSPRWNSQHYNFDHSTPSTLPKSILKDGDSFVKYLSKSVDEKETEKFLSALRTAEQYLKEHPGQSIEKELSNTTNTTNTIKSWLENNTSRMEFKISAKDKESMFAARFLESFLHFLLTPRYEGRVTTIK